MKRRDFVGGLAASAALQAFAAGGPQAVGLKTLGNPQPFDYAWLKGQARALAGAPMPPPSGRCRRRSTRSTGTSTSRSATAPTTRCGATRSCASAPSSSTSACTTRRRCACTRCTTARRSELAYDPELFDYGKSGLDGTTLPKRPGLRGLPAQLPHRPRARRLRLPRRELLPRGRRRRGSTACRRAAWRSTPACRDRRSSRPSSPSGSSARRPTSSTHDGLRAARLAERHRRLPLRHHARRHAGDGRRRRALSAQDDRAARHRAADEHVPDRRERPPHGQRLAPGDPRLRRPADVDRQPANGSGGR